MSNIDSFDVVDNMIRGYVRSCLNNRVYRANSNSPFEDGEYATALLISVEKSGTPIEKIKYIKDDDMFIKHTKDEKYYNYSFMICRSNDGYQKALKLSLFHKTNQGKIYLSENNMLVCDVSNIRDVSSIFSNEYENRMSIDLKFKKKFNIYEKIEAIEEIDYKLKYEA